MTSGSGQLATLRHAVWLGAVRRAAIVVWLAIPAVGLLDQPLAGRLVWTGLLACLPLVIVLIGYHRWRAICPLAWLNQLPVRLPRASSRRMPTGLERRYYYIPLVVFTFCLWLRLIWINGDGIGIALFFVGFSMMALVFGKSTTGKTWCNYICPVLFIEKIYTEPCGLWRTENSQCFPCTACKRACPDINQQNAYWKEIGLPAKSVAYFVYPGLVFGFYLYYFLQSGTLEHYVNGTSTDQPGILWHAFSPGYDSVSAGFFFLPWIPRAVASLVTLVACAAISWALFARGVVPLVNWWLSSQQPTAYKQNVVFGIAAFTAFVTFYLFAWEPILHTDGWLLLVANILTICVAALSLFRRLRTHPAVVARYRSLHP